jgi:ABC-type branched-subunit amino acid transport system substrate-binding protein
MGLVLPMSGVIGLAGPSALEAVTLAGRELQHSATSFDRGLEFVLIDSGGPPRRVAERVADLAHSHTVDAFVGLHTSDVLEAIEHALAPGPVPYVFTPGHEDADRLPGFYCSGEPPQVMAVGLARVIADRHVSEWAIVGTDYVWPRAMRDSARAVIEANGGRVVLDRLLPLGRVRREAPRFVDELIRSGARGVIVNMPGRDLSTTLLAVRARGLDKALLRFSGSLEENALYALGGDRSGNLYSTSHSFESLQSPRHQELNDKYRFAFGDESPVLNSWAEHCYDGVHLLARLDRSGLLSTASLDSHPDNHTPAEAAMLRPQYESHLAVAVGMTFEVL